ncbi:acid phosphatase [Sphingomonas sp. S2-65]|uniref:acid phosphatase n=1 Tax=Sphingomonas sp. S2-65 TaxID=2903960 RepID=UPI001F327B32|nr:phosphatase PAP2 family protein [Sphingomonas sp. S2-65]UYY59828.1 phosphatase PAP2 family protein [Sphingomonas sp. S2-65]
MKVTLLAVSALLLVAADQSVPGYLDGKPVPDLMRVLPAPPEPGSAPAADDRATFEATRKAQGSDRWTLATRDVTDDRFTAFSCALGRKLDAKSAPRLAALFSRMSDGGMTGHAKTGFATRRPYLSQSGEICEPKTEHLAGNGDYPSGHTATGWSTALVLAELVPERATEILRRGRVYGESRFICGSHSRSAVQAGFLAGASLVARWHAEPAFRADMDAARAELATLRGARGPDADRCRIEASAG